MPHVLATGIRIFDFWEMTLEEILKTLDGEKLRQRQISQQNYILANLIGISCSRIVGDTEFPSFDTAYPEYFEKREKTWEEMKEQMLIFAEQHNKARKEGKK